MSQSFFVSKNCRNILLFLGLSLASAAQAELTDSEIQQLESACTKKDSYLFNEGRHFSLSPDLSMAQCIVIDSFHTYAHSYRQMLVRHEESKALVTDRFALLNAVLTELNYLSTGFKGGTLGYPASLNQQTQGVLTKNMVTRDLTLLHLLLKEVDIFAALDAEGRNRIVQTMVTVADSLGHFLYSYDMMTSPCPSDSSKNCPKLLFMASALWTDIVHRLDSAASLDGHQFQRLEPYLNNMLEAHAQALFGIPLYIRVYDPRSMANSNDRDYPMDHANRYYQEGITHWGMTTDWHQSQYSAASLKMWGYMRDNPNFRFSMQERISYSNDAHHYGELSLKRLQTMISAHGQTPRAGNLIVLPSYRIEMYYGISNRTEAEKVLNMASVFNAADISSFETYSQRNISFPLD